MPEKEPKIVSQSEVVWINKTTKKEKIKKSLEFEICDLFEACYL